MTRPTTATGRDARFVISAHSKNLRSKLVQRVLVVVTVTLGLLDVSPPSTVIGQTREPEKFDVVSVKENRSGGQPFIRPEPSGLTVVNKTALELIMYEFNVLKRDVVGELPDWAKTTTFDVIAKTPNAPLTSSRLRAMTRALLEDRF